MSSMTNKNMYNKKIKLNKYDVEQIINYLSELILLADSGELAVSVSHMINNLKHELTEQKTEFKDDIK